VTSFDTPDLEGLFAGRVATTGQKSAAYFFVLDANVSRLSASMSRFTQRLRRWIAIILIPAGHCDFSQGSGQIAV
jgi:hypothetical protein